MSEVSDRHSWAVYRQFKTMEDHSFRSIVRYFEEHRRRISELPFDEYFELLVEYTHALFETGKYHKHIEATDEVIEWVIHRNITFYKGHDILRKSLFKKAASHYNLYQLSEARHIIGELLKMDPKDSKSRRFMVRCFRRNPSSIKQKMRAVCIALILLSALAISLELLVIRPFYEPWISAIELARNLLFISGIAVFISGEGIHRFRAWQNMRQRLNDISE